MFSFMNIFNYLSPKELENILFQTKYHREQNQSLLDPSSAFFFFMQKNISNIRILLGIYEGCEHKTTQLYNSNYSPATGVA